LAHFSFRVSPQFHVSIAARKQKKQWQ